MRQHNIIGFSLLVCLFASLSGCSGHTSSRGQVADALFAPVEVVFMGDSITQYWGPGQLGNSNAFIANATWVDVGVSGQTSGQMLERFQRDVVARAPKIVHILAGTNDVYPGWVLCGGDANVDTCDNIKSMVAMARAAGIQVVLGTIPPWGLGDASKGFDPSPERYTRINQLNQWITRYCEAESLTVVDYHALLATTNGKTYVPNLTFDGIHPSREAYPLMTVAARRAISDAEQK